MTLDGFLDITPNSKQNKNKVGVTKMKNLGLKRSSPTD